MLKLDPYQDIGAETLAANARLLLADEQGLGKTAQAIRAIDALLDVGFLASPAKVCVISPASLRDNWRNEIKKWSSDPSRFALFQFSYEGATNALDKKTPAAAQIRCADVVILDESHYLKTPSSNRTRAIFPALKEVPYVWALSGTPNPNGNPAELWSTLWYMAPERIQNKRGETMREWEFTNRYCRTIETSFGPKVIGLKNAEELKERLAGFVLRRRKSEVATELPPIRFGDILLRCPQEDWSELKGFADDFLLVDDELPPPDEHVAYIRKRIAEAKTKPLLSMLEDELLDPEYKVVVFGHHKEPLDRIAHGLKAFSPAMITGDTPVNKRQAQVDRFQNDPKCQVFIGNIKAAGTGLTLTAASNLVFLELSWTPGENDQAAMRVHRKGQTKPVLIRTAQLAGTIDETVVKTLARKLEMLKQLGLQEAA